MPVLRQLNRAVSCALNLVIGLWLAHWSLSFWRDVQAGKNGITQAMLIFNASLALDRFRLASLFFDKLTEQRPSFVSEQTKRVLNLSIIILALMNLYRQIEKDVS